MVAVPTMTELLHEQQSCVKEGFFVVVMRYAC